MGSLLGTVFFRDRWVDGMSTLSKPGIHHLPVDTEKNMYYYATYLAGTQSNYKNCTLIKENNGHEFTSVSGRVEEFRH